jgi:hypothetical protein
VPLNWTDQLAKEWFLVADSPDYFSALATEEITDQGTPENERVFEGILTFEDEMITILQQWLTDLTGGRALAEMQRNYRQQMHLMARTMEHLTSRLERAMTVKEKAQPKHVLETVVTSSPTRPISSN